MRERLDIEASLELEQRRLFARQPTIGFGCLPDSRDRAALEQLLVARQTGVARLPADTPITRDASSVSASRRRTAPRRLAPTGSSCEWHQAARDRSSATGGAGARVHR